MYISSLFSVGSAALPPFFSQNRHRLRRAHPPISISTNPSHVDILRLRDLFASSGHSCHRFPVPSGDGLVEPTDPGKLRIAIYHSFIVVSVFCRSNFLPSAVGGSNKIPEETSAAIGFQDFFERNFRAPGPDHHLIGFGRAVSDRGLTASIHDVVILPSLQKRGIGRKIVERIIRILTNKGIYDISALCSEKERDSSKTSFFHLPPGAFILSMPMLTIEADAETSSSFSIVIHLFFPRFLYSVPRSTFSS